MVTLQYRTFVVRLSFLGNLYFWKRFIDVYYLKNENHNKILSNRTIEKHPHKGDFTLAYFT